MVLFLKRTLYCAAILLAVTSTRITASAQEDHTLFAQIITRFSGGRVPTIHGTTTLPDGTILTSILLRPKRPDANSRVAIGLPACDPNCLPIEPKGEVIVRNGEFTIGPITDAGSDLRPGVYILQIDVIANQPSSVTYVLGQHGENLRGPLIYVLADGGYYQKADPPWNPNRSEAEAVLGFTVHSTQRLVIP